MKKINKIIGIIGLFLPIFMGYVLLVVFELLPYPYFITENTFIGHPIILLMIISLVCDIYFIIMNLTEVTADNKG